MVYLDHPLNLADNKDHWDRLHNLEDSKDHLLSLTDLMDHLHSLVDRRDNQNHQHSLEHLMDQPLNLGDHRGQRDKLINLVDLMDRLADLSLEDNRDNKDHLLSLQDLRDLLDHQLSFMDPIHQLHSLADHLYHPDYLLSLEALTDHQDNQLNSAHHRDFQDHLTSLAGQMDQVDNLIKFQLPSVVLKEQPLHQGTETTMGRLGLLRSEDSLSSLLSTDLREHHLPQRLATMMDHLRLVDHKDRLRHQRLVVHRERQHTQRSGTIIVPLDLHRLEYHKDSLLHHLEFLKEPRLPLHLETITGRLDLKKHLPQLSETTNNRHLVDHKDLDLRTRSRASIFLENSLMI